jgi:hypothetical protein
VRLIPIAIGMLSKPHTDVNRGTNFLLEPGLRILGVGDRIGRWELAERSAANLVPGNI